MAIFRPILYINKKFHFYKLLGCGQKGSFQLHPDWNQYGIITVNNSEDFSSSILQSDYTAWKQWYYGKFISSWWKFLGVETWTIVLKPITSHGRWNGVELFNNISEPYKGGQIAVLTRASIRPSKAIEFWKNIASVEQEIVNTKGLKFSVGIGEMPLLRQATFSVWTDMDSMKSFAYERLQHQTVIRKTRERNWYSEELFARFIPLQTAGSLRGGNPIG